MPAAAAADRISRLRAEEEETLSNLLEVRGGVHMTYPHCLETLQSGLRQYCQWNMRYAQAALHFPVTSLKLLPRSTMYYSVSRTNSR